MTPSLASVFVSPLSTDGLGVVGVGVGLTSQGLLGVEPFVPYSSVTAGSK